MTTSHLDETTKIYQVKERDLSLWHSSKAFRNGFIQSAIESATAQGFASWAILCGDLDLDSSEAHTHA